MDMMKRWVKSVLGQLGRKWAWVAVAGLGLALGYAGAAEPPTGSFDLKVDSGRVSLRVSQAPLGEVLKALAQQAHLTFRIAQDEAQEPISMQFKDLSLTQSLQRLLQSKNYVILQQTLLSGSNTSKGREMAEVRVFPRSSDATMQKISPGSDVVAQSGEAESQSGEESTLSELKQAATQGATVEERVKALRGLENADEDSEAVAAVMTQVLEGDQEPKVREMALTLLTDLQGPQAAEAIAKVALHDASASVRVEALSELVAIGPEHERSREILRQAMERDTDPGVREAAKKLTEMLDEEAKARAEAAAKAKSDADTDDKTKTTR